MDVERLKELRERAKVVDTQVAVAKRADEMVEFFIGVRRRFKNDGNMLQLGVSSMEMFPYNSTNTAISPGYASDRELNLWRACMAEIHEQVRAVVSQLLDTYIQMAEAHRDETLCGVCGEDYQPTVEGRELRGVHLREKGDG